jgi:hypothetical protein
MGSPQPVWKFWRKEKFLACPVIRTQGPSAHILVTIPTALLLTSDGKKKLVVSLPALTVLTPETSPRKTAQDAGLAE